MVKEKLFKQMNELCEKAKIKEMDIEEILKIRSRKAFNSKKQQKYES